MDSTAQLAVNGPNIVHEIIEGEVVIVDMNNGYYYSSEHTGAAIWRLIDGGSSLQQIVEALASRFPGALPEIERTTREFIEQLCAERLVVASGARAQRAAAIAGLEELGPAFTAPVLHKHQDMQDLLLIDPIHEVESAGWPHKQADLQGKS